jgi:predicted MPP superfamily phosphohydrolase
VTTQGDIGALRAHKNAVRTRHRRRDEPPRVLYSRQWYAAGAVGGLLALLALRLGGARAAGLLGLLGALGTGYVAGVEPSRPRLRQLTLALPDLPPALEGLRVGQLSDLHLGKRYSEQNVRRAVEWMRHERPDLIVITGDFVSYEHAIARIGPLLRDLRAPLGVYAVPGNHDYMEGVDAITAELAALGIPMLLNEHRRLEWRGGELWLLGVDDVWEGVADLDAALAGVPASSWKLLLSHVPDFVDESAKHGVALQLSGHTHGGHLRLPVIGPFTLPRYGVLYPYGLLQVGVTTLYVSGGLAGIPLRLRCPPEATIFTFSTGKS